MASTIKIKELDLNLIEPSSQNYKNVKEGQGGSKIVIIGKPKTGKSWLVRSLLYAKKDIFPVGMVMSGTEDSNSFYKKIFPDTFIFNSYNEEQIEKFVKRQKLARQHLENPWAYLVLDDVIDDPSVFRRTLQQRLFKMGRHWAMLYLVVMQYALDLRPSIRTSIDGVFILREPNIVNRRKLYENYAGVIPDFTTFCHLMDQLTDDFGALYIHNLTDTNDWKDCVFWYKAKPVPKDFKVGCDDYWDFHFDRYNPDFVEQF